MDFISIGKKSLQMKISLGPGSGRVGLESHWAGPGRAELKLNRAGPGHFFVTRFEPWDLCLVKKAVSAIPVGLKCETRYSCYY